MTVTKTMPEKMEICRLACIECQTTCIEILNYCKTLGNVDMTLMCMMRDCAEMSMMCVNMIMDGSEFVGRTCELCAQMCVRTALACELHSDEKIRSIAVICRQCAEDCQTIAQQSAAYFRRPISLTMTEVAV